MIRDEGDGGGGAGGAIQEEYDALRLQEADNYNAEALAKLIRTYHAESGASGDATFDKRVRVTLAGIDKALEWVASESDALSPGRAR